MFWRQLKIVTLNYKIVCVLLNRYQMAFVQLRVIIKGECKLLGLCLLSNIGRTTTVKEYYLPKCL